MILLRIDSKDLYKKIGINNRNNIFKRIFNFLLHDKIQKISLNVRVSYKISLLRKSEEK